MKALVLYAYPPEPDGLSLQGDMLYRGFKENGQEAMACHWKGGLQKEWAYRHFKPDVVVGIGYWGYTPDIVLEPQRFNLKAVPWLVADGWVAKHHQVLSELPLVFVTSQWVKETYQRDGVKVNNFEVLPVGVEPNIFRPIDRAGPAIQKLRQMFGIEPWEKVIMTIGGDVTSKGAQEILKALALVDKDFSNWKYICKTWESDCAEGHLEEEMALMDELGLDKRKIIHLQGAFSHDFMPYLLNLTDVYAAPSRLEGFGMIQVEAQACGTPVISIDAMGPKETILHEQTGFLAKVASTVDLESEIINTDEEEKTRIFFDKPKTFAYRADVEDLRKYLLCLLTDDVQRIKMGRRAREHALSFDYRKIASRAAQLIKERLCLTDS